MSSPATVCAWCGAELTASVGGLRGRRVCRRCGAATTDPWPDPEEIERSYGDWYRPSGGRRFSFTGDALLGWTRGLLATRIDRIAPPGPVLDVGAGAGTLLDALHARGREATGLERGSHRPDFREEALVDIAGEGEWAAIVLWHALEHLPDPGDAIRAAARLLAVGGVVAVAVPNNASLQAQAFGDEWLHLDLPRHLVHLSTRSLTAGLQRAGFRVERISNVRGGQIVVGWLDGLVGRLGGGLDLYQALRRPEARSDRLDLPRRLASIAAGVALLPLAALAAALEIALHRGGTVYVEGRIG